MNHNSSSFQAALQVAYQSPLAHLENLGNRPVAATAGLSELRSKLAKPLNDHSLDPEEVVRNLVRDTQGGIVGSAGGRFFARSEEHTSELQSLRHLVCRLLLEK